ncbi:hypothetical protein [Saccharopolyspora sp. NPDC002686]|uniref:hypothetical protein n=1 Tax=Saccharopolyspora sp. NPDC002686 TaxID=3154541 RepID=UPI00331E9932
MTESDRRKADLQARVQYHADAVKEHVAALEAINSEIAALEAAEAEGRKRNRWLRAVPEVSLAATLTGAAVWVHDKANEHRSATTLSGLLVAVGGLAALLLLTPADTETPAALPPPAAPRFLPPDVSTPVKPMLTPQPDYDGPAERESTRQVIVAAQRERIDEPAPSQPSAPPDAPISQPPRPEAPPADGPSTPPRLTPPVPPAATDDPGEGNNDRRESHLCLRVHLDPALHLSACLG